MISMSTIGSFGATVFSDIDSVPWAKDFINKMADKSIIKGSMDDKTLKIVYRPSANVSYNEAIQMIYNFLKATNRLKSTTGLVAKYQASLTVNNIPTWAQEAVAYALEDKIITSGDLGSFMKGDNQNPARRVDVAMFVGKALNMEDELSMIPILDFKDAETIIKSAMPYVELLANKKIISGDLDKKFNPNNPITRAEMAVVCSKTYDLLMATTNNTTPTIPTTPTTPAPATNYETKLRVIDFINSDATMMVVKDDKGNTEVYSMDVTILVKKGNSFLRARDLRIGDTVKLSLDNKDKLVSIEIDNSSADFTGILQSIKDYDNYHLIVVKDKLDPMIKKEFKIDDDTDIRLDGKSVSTSKLYEGDSITVKSMGLRATKVTIESSEMTYEGILEENKYHTIKVRTNNNQVIELEVSDRVYVRRDGSRSDIIDLMTGDIVTVTVEYNEVTDIRAIARSVESEDEGTIKAIIIGSPSKITIVSKDDNEEYTYEISSNVDVKIGRDYAKIYDLRPGYTVELEIENKVVMEIDAEKVEEKNTISAEITRVYSDINRLKVEYIDSTTRERVIRFVEVSDDTRIISSDATSIRLSQLGSGDEVFIEGYYVDDLFVAKRIIQLD
jgi:hypothetical protein